MAKKKARKKKGRTGIARRHRGLATQLKRRGIDSKMISAKPGTVKMSEVIIDFLQPYQEHATTYEAHRKLTTLGVIAWNASLFPEDEAQAMIEKAFDGQPLAAREQGIEFIEELMERKKKHLAEYKRPILDYQLTDDGDEWHLSVVSWESISKDKT